MRVKFKFVFLHTVLFLKRCIYYPTRFHIQRTSTYNAVQIKDLYFVVPLMWTGKCSNCLTGRDEAHVCHFDNCEHSLKASPDTPRQCWRERHKGGMLMSTNERGCFVWVFNTLFLHNNINCVPLKITFVHFWVSCCCSVISKNTAAFHLECVASGF